MFSCCVTREECHREFNPWSKADTEVQGLSTAALEALEEHVAVQSADTEYFAHLYTVAKKEIASRQLNSYSAKSNASTSSKQTTEVVFDVDDFGPPIALLDDQKPASDCVYGHSESELGEIRDSIAKMSLAWVYKTREKRLRRTDGRRPAPVEHREADKVVDVIDIDVESSICFEDVEGLENEMEIYF